LVRVWVYLDLAGFYEEEVLWNGALFVNDVVSLVALDSEVELEYGERFFLDCWH
jgi:hypothetical protein